MNALFAGVQLAPPQQAIRLEVGGRYEVAFGQVESARRTWAAATYEREHAHARGTLHVFRLGPMETYSTFTPATDVRVCGSQS